MDWNETATPEQRAAINALADWLIRNFDVVQIRAYVRVMFSKTWPGDWEIAAAINQKMPRDLVDRLDAAHPGAKSFGWFPAWRAGNRGHEIWYSLQCAIRGISGGQTLN